MDARPSSVKIIGNNAFSGCSSLVDVVIPESVTYIGSFSFSGCLSLKQLKIPSSVSEIGELAFKGCNSLDKIEIPPSTFYTDLGISVDLINQLWNFWKYQKLFEKEQILKLTKHN